MRCGLHWRETGSSGWQYQNPAVPIDHVDVQVVIVETTSEVNVKQVYRNSLTHVIEAIYAFPLDDNAAICEFEAQIGENKVVGIVKSKKEARKEYKEAVKKGDGAYLLEQDRPDIFRTKIGNIPPGATVQISIKYVAEIKNELEKTRFVIPMVIAPRYQSNFGEGEKNREDVAPTSSAAVTTSIKATCVSPNGISSLESPSHRISTQMENQSTFGIVTLAEEVTALEKDFVLLISYAKPHEPKAVLEENEKGSCVIMISLFPHFEFPETKTELVFLIDRSGSMSSKVFEVREAMALFLRSMPPDCYFNIVGFGDTYQTFFPRSAKYDDDTVAKAEEHVNRLEADLGGTEILQPLQEIFGWPLIERYSRQIFLLTDGQVSNEKEVMNLVAKHAKTARVFTLGIGDSVSHHLVEGVARNGNGTSFFAIEGERIEKKVLKQLKDATQPALSKVEVNWSLNVASQTPNVKRKQSIGKKIGKFFSNMASSFSSHSASSSNTIFKGFQAPFTIPPVYDNSHFRVYCLFEEGEIPGQVVVRAESPDGPLVAEIPVDQSKVIKGNLLHKLAARVLIRDLEEGTSVFHSQSLPNIEEFAKTEIIRLGTTYSLVSKYTSFIAVEKRSSEQKEEEKEEFDCYREKLEEKEEQPDRLSRRRSIDEDDEEDSSAAEEEEAEEEKSEEKSRDKEKEAYSDKEEKVVLSKKEKSAPTQSARNISPASPPILMMSLADSNFSPPPPSAPFSPPSSFSAPPPPPPSSSFSEKKKDKNKASAIQDTRTQFLSLIKLQTSQGSFTYSDKLAGCMDITMETLEKLLAQPEVAEMLKDLDRANQEKVVASAMALGYLKVKLADMKEEWEMVESKAKRWLNAQKLKDLGLILDAAEKLLGIEKTK